MNELKEFRKKYSRYFVDLWMYLFIIVGTIIAAIIFFCRNPTVGFPVNHQAHESWIERSRSWFRQMA